MEDARPGCGSEPVRCGEDIENGTIVLEFRLRCGTGMERVLNGGEIYATRSAGANCVCAVDDKVSEESNHMLIMFNYFTTLL